jgi:hypothetical protein
MELRLLDCPRYTNDLDYVFIPFASKKEVSKILADALCVNYAMASGESIKSWIANFF